MIEEDLDKLNTMNISELKKLYYDKLSLGEKDAEIAEIVLKSAESYIDENIYYRNC